MRSQVYLNQFISENNQDTEKFTSLSRAQKKSIARRGRRALYDLPPTLIKRVASIAEEFGLTNSQVAGVLLLHALRDHKAGKIKLQDYRTVSSSPRYNYKIDLEELIDEWKI